MLPYEEEIRQYIKTIKKDQLPGERLGLGVMLTF